jgi:hypothetical protein
MRLSGTFWNSESVCNDQTGSQVTIYDGVSRGRTGSYFSELFEVWRRWVDASTIKATEHCRWVFVLCEPRCADVFSGNEVCSATAREFLRGEGWLYAEMSRCVVVFDYIVDAEESQDASVTFNTQHPYF